MVVVEEIGDVAMTFTESGTWCAATDEKTRFRNVFRWSRGGKRNLRLEHLRFGEHRPVYLFDLALAAEQQWRSVSPHVCGEDRYTAEMLIGDDRITLRWSVTGPRKMELIEYTYQTSVSPEVLPEGVPPTTLG